MKIIEGLVVRGTSIGLLLLLLPVMALAFGLPLVGLAMASAFFYGVGLAVVGMAFHVMGWLVLASLGMGIIVWIVLLFRTLFRSADKLKEGW